MHYNNQTFYSFYSAKKTVFKTYKKCQLNSKLFHNGNKVFALFLFNFQLITLNGIPFNFPYTK